MDFSQTFVPGMSISLKSGGVEYVGKLHEVEKRLGRIVLKNVSTEGAKLFGPQQFFAKEISDITCNGDTNESVCETSKRKEARKGPCLFKKKEPAHHIKKLRNIDSDDMSLFSTVLRDGQDLDQGFESETFEEYYEDDDHILICKIGEKFRDAIEHIMRQEEVGVSVEGVDIGRNGKLSLISVSTKVTVFVFDMIRMEQVAFAEGLKAFFEDENILKIIYDCRWFSDMMQKVYEINLNNIFDTQVAGAFVYRECNNGDWPRYVESLNNQLVHYLDHDPRSLVFERVRDHLIKEDESVWTVRPIPEKLMTVAVANCRYLLDLKNQLLEGMFLQFKKGVELYLNYTKLFPEGSIDKQKNYSHLLPSSFIDIPNMVSSTERQWKKSYKRSEKGKEYDRNGFLVDSLASIDKSITTNNRSTWHKNTTPFHNKSMTNKDIPEACGPAELKTCASKPDVNRTQSVRSSAPSMHHKETLVADFRTPSMDKAEVLNLDFQSNSEYSVPKNGLLPASYTSDNNEEFDSFSLDNDQSDTNYVSSPDNSAQRNSLISESLKRSKSSVSSKPTRSELLARLILKKRSSEQLKTQETVTTPTKTTLLDFLSSRENDSALKSGSISKPPVSKKLFNTEKVDMEVGKVADKFTMQENIPENYFMTHQRQAADRSQCGRLSLLPCNADIQDSPESVRRSKCSSSAAALDFSKLLSNSSSDDGNSPLVTRPSIAKTDIVFTCEGLRSKNLKKKQKKNSNS